MKLKYSTKPDDLEKINSPEELKKIVRTHEKAAKRLKWQRKALLWILGLILATAAYFGAVWFCSNALANYFIHDIPAITVKRVQAAEVKHKPLTIEDYICTKEWDCKTAVAIAKAESGLRCDAQNVNKGTNSLDLGVMQINSVHLKKGWKVADLLDCHKNIDLAYEIYKGSGWGAWSTYNNKSFKRFL